MAKPQPINCPVCGECCGRYHQPTFECDGESDGLGEDFPDVEGDWCCSEECRIASNGIKADRIVADRDLKNRQLVREVNLLVEENKKCAAQVAELLRRGAPVSKIGDPCTVCHALVSMCACFGETDRHAADDLVRRLVRENPYEENR